MKQKGGRPKGKTKIRMTQLTFSVPTHWPTIIESGLDCSLSSWIREAVLQRMEREDLIVKRKLNHD